MTQLFFHAVYARWLDGCYQSLMLNMNENVRIHANDILFGNDDWINFKSVLLKKIQIRKKKQISWVLCFSFGNENQKIDRYD